MIFHCYTLLTSTIDDGIDSSAHDCVISTSPRLMTAAVDAVPVMDDCLDPQLFVSFVTETSEPECRQGAVLAFDPKEWRLAYVDSRVALVDGSSHAGMSLVVLASGMDCILASASDRGMFLSVGNDGKPAIVSHNRASMMLNAIRRTSPGSPDRPAYVPYGISLPASSALEAPQASPRKTPRKKKPAL